MHRRYPRHALWPAVFHHTGTGIWVLVGTNVRRCKREDSLYHTHRTVRIQGEALWTMQCSSNLSTPNGNGPGRPGKEEVLGAPG